MVLKQGQCPSCPGNFCNSVSHVTTAGGEMVLASAVWRPGTQIRNLVYTRGPFAERNYLLLFSKCKTIKGEKPWSKDEGGKIQQNASNTHSKGVHRVCGSGHDKAQHEQPPYGALLWSASLQALLQEGPSGRSLGLCLPWNAICTDSNTTPAIPSCP